ncbi:MAG: CRISPR-associated endoribonuclease Cas6 [Blastocatellia bacterium]
MYGILGSASEKFASMLHDTGFEVGGRRFKLFTFSRLMPRASHVAGGNLELDQPQVELLISSPLREFVETFVAGLFQSETFRIDREEFHLEAAETIVPPEFTSRMTFRALSPITETVPEPGREHARFLSVNDSDELWSEIIGRNLARKYMALHKTEPEDASLSWEWDRKYIEQYESRGKRASVLLSIGSGAEEIKVRGWLAPFTVRGSVELIRLGYEAGFGSRNSIGFGMVE